MRFLLYLAGFVVTYFLAWTASYVLTWVLRGDHVDFTYYFDYFVAAWTFGGLELPPFMLIASIIIFIPLAVLFVWIMRRTARAREPHAP